MSRSLFGKLRSHDGQHLALAREDRPVRMAQHPTKRRTTLTFRDGAIIVVRATVDQLIAWFEGKLEDLGDDDDTDESALQSLARAAEQAHPGTLAAELAPEVAERKRGRGKAKSMTADELIADTEARLAARRAENEALFAGTGAGTPAEPPTEG